MKTKKRILLILSWCILVGIFASIVKTVSAYTYTGGRWSSKNITYYYDSWNSTKGKSAFQTGMTDWNSAVSNISISYSYPNGISINEGVYPNVGWDGVAYSYWNTSGYFTTVSIIINTSQTSTWNNSGALKSVVSHEIGHGLGLGENGYQKTIMNSYTFGTNSRYGTHSLTKPQADDILGVNNRYK